MRIGDIRIDPLVDGEVRYPREVQYPDVRAEDWDGLEQHLDEGAVVNVLGGYLVRTEDRVIVVDAGVGSKAVHPFTGGAFRQSLMTTGVDPAAVTDVIFTHLHFDHIGWATQRGKPTFPNARYRCDRRDWEYFTAQDYQTPAWEQELTHPEEDSVPARFAAVAESMELWDGDAELLSGVRAVDAAGHTPGHCALLLSSRGEQGMLVGDTVHSIPELLRGWRGSGDLDGAQSRETMRRIRGQLADHEMPFAAAHFPGLKWHTISRDGDGWDLREVADRG